MTHDGYLSKTNALTPALNLSQLIPALPRFDFEPRACFAELPPAMADFAASPTPAAGLAVAQCALQLRLVTKQRERTSQAATASVLDVRIEALRAELRSLTAAATAPAGPEAALQPRARMSERALSGEVFWTGCVVRGEPEPSGPVLGFRCLVGPDRPTAFEPRGVDGWVKLRGEPGWLMAGKAAAGSSAAAELTPCEFYSPGRRRGATPLARRGPPACDVPHGGACLVISLRRAAKRREHVEGTLLVRCGPELAPAELLEACDGHALTAAEKRHLAEADRHRQVVCALAPTPERPEAPYVLQCVPLGAGQAGCALSHRAALTAIVDRGWPWAVLMEDDADVGPGFGAAVAALVAKAPADMDVAYLGYGNHELDGDADERRGWTKLKWAYCTHAMLFTRDGALRALQTLEPLWMPIDHHYVHATKDGWLNAYAATPAIADWNPLHEESFLAQMPEPVEM